MLVSSTSVHGKRVTIAGRVVRPLGAPVQRVIVKRRLSCGRYRVIKPFTPPPSGHFEITVGGPGSQQAAVYRLQTRVRKFTTNTRLYPDVHPAEVRRPRVGAVGSRETRLTASVRC